VKELNAEDYSYGVSRVYDQQCGYVLHDAQLAQNNMRQLLKIMKNNDLEPAAMKSRWVLIR